MSSSTMSLIGLYNFLDYQGIDLFQKLSLPDGIDKETCINNILLECEDKELLFPDANFMIEAIGLWSKKWERTFEKWAAVFALDYNPIENYDRKENWSDSASTSESNFTSVHDSSSNSNSNKNDVSAFNAGTYAPESASDVNGVARSDSNATAHNQKAELSKHEGRIHGNIGVTTTQQMIQSEIELQRFNIYNEIAIIFMREFVLAL